MIAESQGKKPTKDHTETDAAADPDRAKKEMEAKHQGDRNQHEPQDITNDLSPEERTHIRKKVLSTTNLDRDGSYEEAKNTITTAGGEKGTEKKEHREPDEARGTDGHERAPHYPREARLRHVLGAAIRICEEEDEAGKGPGKEGGGQTEGNK